MRNKITIKKGFSLAEIIVYIAIFSAVSVAVINSYVVILASFNSTRVARSLLESGSTSMERISREIRQAKSVDIANSTLGSNPGVLQMNSTDGSGNAMVVKFVTASGALNLYENNVLIGNLIASDISVTNLIFRRTTTSQGEAIKVELSLADTGTNVPRTENFYDTIILRGEY